MNWWCEHWNRPMKDPVLQTYTFEELMYEFYSIRERKKAIVERAEEENDKIEEEKTKEAEEWANQMEAMEAMEAIENDASDPLKNPDNIKWMEEQMALDKEEFGEDFGEDLSLSFDSPPNIEDI